MVNHGRPRLMSLKEATLLRHRNRWIGIHRDARARAGALLRRLSAGAFCLAVTVLVLDRIDAVPPGLKLLFP
jgi:hypothetical protein